MTLPQPPRVIPLSGLLAGSLLAGAAFGASSALVPMVKLNALILIGVAIILFALAAGLRQGRLVKLLAALVAGALAVAAMWAVWFGLLHGWPHLWSLLRQGPAAIEATIRHLGATTTYRVSTGSGTNTHGPSEVAMFWWIETGLLMAAPLLGALFSPAGRRSPTPAV